jgi:hypothetical protein
MLNVLSCGEKSASLASLKIFFYDTQSSNLSRPSG